MAYQVELPPPICMSVCAHAALLPIQFPANLAPVADVEEIPGFCLVQPSCCNPLWSIKRMEDFHLSPFLQHCLQISKLIKNKENLYVFIFFNQQLLKSIDMKCANRSTTAFLL